jgi:uncharacterized protein YbdZ (MbtH family)
MRHLEPNIKVNEMKGKNKPISLIFISLLVLSTIMIIYTPTLHAGTSPKTYTEVTLEPQFVSGAYPYPTRKFVINVTGLPPAEDNPIDTVEVTLPTGWSVVGHEDPSGWSFASPAKWSAIDPTKEIKSGVKLYFNLTLGNISPGMDQAWTIKCSDTNVEPPETDTHTLYVDVSSWFDAKITPIVTNKKVSKVFTITVKNNASTSPIYKVEIAYGADYTWTGGYDVPDGWSLSHNPIDRTFTLAASAATYYIKYGYEKTFKFNMTSADVASDKDETWTVTVTNVDGVTDTLQLKTYIDITSPDGFHWKEPAGYAGYLSVDGGYVWLNITFNDKYYGADYWPTVVPNVTQFTLYSRDAYPKAIFEPSTFTYNFRGTNIPDGLLVVHFNITDYVGNSLTKQEVITVVDNKAPIITIAVESAIPKVEGGVTVWYVGPVPSVNIWVNFTEAEAYNTYNAYDTSLLSAKKIGLYVNGSWQTISSFTWDTAKQRYCAKVTYPVTVGKCYELFANITDAARPHNHTSSARAYLKFDLKKPEVPTWVSYTVIKGGVLIKGLTATDDVAVYKLKVYNGTQLFVDIPFDKLGSPTLWCDANKKVFIFKDYVILNLTASVGKTLSIKIAAVDYGQNEGDNSTEISVLVEGYFYPLVLRKGWNLISFPIIPETEAYDTIKTWFLAGNLKFVYGYDPASGFVLNPSMTHGKGYWVYVTDYDVLLVRGSTTELPLPPALPVSYNLTKGWNLAGYTSIYTRSITEYLSSLESNSFYKYVYIWDATKQAWTMVNATDPNNKLSPGTAFWIYMYKDQTLVPPVP